MFELVGTKTCPRISDAIQQQTRGPNISNANLAVGIEFPSPFHRIEKQLAKGKSDGIALFLWQPRVKFLEKGMDAVGRFASARNEEFHPFGFCGDDFDETQCLLTKRPLGYFNRILWGKRFVEIFARLCTSVAKDRLLRVVARHDDNLWARRKISSFLKYFKPCHFGHPDIDKCEVEIGFSEFFKGFHTIVSLCNAIARVFEHARDGETRGAIVIRDEDALLAQSFAFTCHLVVLKMILGGPKMGQYT